MKNRNSLIQCIMLLVVVLSILLITGCESTGNSQIKTANIALEDEPYTVTDARGRKITLPKKPSQIVSTTYGTDEILVELVDLQRIKSFCRYAGDPEITFITSEQVKRVKNKVGENLEAIVALQPDLVFVSEATNYSMVKTLEEMKIPVYVAASPKNYEGMKNKILGIAKAVREEQRGQRVVAIMDNKLASIEKSLRPITKEKQKVAMAFSYLSVVGRKGNLLDDIFIRAKVRNGAVEAGLVQGADSLSKEKVVDVNPDVFLVPTWTIGGKNDPVVYAEQLRQDPAYKQVKAVKNNLVVPFPDKYKYVASQHLADSIEAMAKVVYPEYFK